MSAKQMLRHHFREQRQLGEVATRAIQEAVVNLVGRSICGNGYVGIYWPYRVRRIYVRCVMFSIRRWPCRSPMAKEDSSIGAGPKNLFSRMAAAFLRPPTEWLFGPINWRFCWCRR